MIWTNTSFGDPGYLLKGADIKLQPASGDGNCMFRVLAMVKGFDFCNTVSCRFLMINYTEKSAQDFKKYLSDESIKMHLKRLK